MLNLSAYQYNPHGAAVITAGIGILILGLFIWAQKPRCPKNISFFAVTFSAFPWLLATGMMSLAKNGGTAMHWVPVNYLGVPFISPSVYLFSVLWLELEEQKKFAYLCLIPALLFSLTMVFFSQRFAVEQKFWWGYLDGFSGPGFSYLGIFLVFFLALAFKSFHNFIRARKIEQSEIKKRQLSYIIIAFLIAYTGIWDFVPAMGVNTYPFGYISIFLFASLIAYSIVKHKLLDIRLVLKRTALLAGIYLTALCLFFALDWPLYEWTSKMIGPRFSVPFLVVTGSLLFSFGAFVYAQMVQSASFFKEQVVSGVTHEFKSPLASIQSALEILNNEISSGQPLDASKGKIADYLLMIGNNTQRLEKFIQNLLEVSKIEQGKPHLDTQETDLNELCRKAVELYQPLAEQNGIRLQFFPDGAKPLHCDPDKIQMAVSNLLSNAVKFTDEGHIEVRVEPKGEEVQISVKDTGVGIPEEDLPHIFDKFYQGKNGHGTKGTGLGLSIVKGWIEAHGGRVWVESNASTGTKFIIELTR